MADTNDDHEDRFWEHASTLLERPGVTRSTMMGLPCLRLNGSFFASFDRRTGDLLVKLPGARVESLLDAGAAHPFAPAGRQFREWAAIRACRRTRVASAHRRRVRSRRVIAATHPKVEAGTMTPFQGFPSEAWRFLDALADDNTAGTFDRHRDIYQSSIANPSHALVEALAPRLTAHVHPALKGEARVGRSLFRINRDTRFSPDKTPYKTYVDFLFWAGDGDPRSSAACIVRLTSTRVLTGAGRIGLRGDDLHRYRTRVADPSHGPNLRAVVDRLVASGATISDAVRARPPRPYPSDSFNANLLCRDGFHLSRIDPHPAVIGGPGFVDWLLERLQPYADLIDMLR